MHEVEATDTFYEDEKVFVMLDRDWAVKGHSLVIWKEHALNMSDLDESDFNHFAKIVRNTEKALLTVTQMDKSVVLKSGGIVSHFHFHIYPVSSNMPWNEIQCLFDKNLRHEPKEGEAAELLTKLRADLALKS